MISSRGSLKMASTNKKTLNVLRTMFRVACHEMAKPFFVVAPPGIAPGPPAYETGEVLLLHSAEDSIK